MNSALPIGIDLGRTRTRIAILEGSANRPTLERVITLDRTRENASVSRLGAAIAAALRESGVRQRRCVMSAGDTAVLREVQFPPMSRLERRKAAAFEAARIVPYPIVDARLALAPIDERRGRFALGIARRDDLGALEKTARAAHLHLAAVDHAALALRRALGPSEAVLDVGVAEGRFAAFGGAVPFFTTVAASGLRLTRAIAASLAIDEPQAERRKLSVGLGGAAANELTAISRATSAALVAARNAGAPEIAQITIVGSGARLAEIAERLERDTGCVVRFAVHLALPAPNYPDDVIRAKAGDWALAVGCALWNVNKPAAA